MAQRKIAKLKGECWIWPYAKNSQGYGNTQYKGKKYNAYKWMWELINGKVPHGTELDHLCKNPLCINPEHLEPVSHAVNCRRGKNTKLSPSEVKKIRELKGKKTQREIGDMFKVSHATVGYIHRGERWN